MPVDEILVSQEKDALINAFKQFVEGPLLKNDFEIGLMVVDDDVIGVGMGEQGHYLSKNGAREIFGGIQKDTPQNETTPVEEPPRAAPTITYSDLDVRVFTPTSATICGKIHVTAAVDGKESTTHLLQMFSAAKQNGQWLFSMIAAVPLDITEEGIEAYQYSFAEDTLAQLKKDLEADSFDLFNRGFSGGVMCTYIKPNYPLCFANDSFIKMLGYEREEFEECFKNNTAKMNAPESEDYMQTISAKGEAGGDFGSRACWLKKDGSKIWVEFRATRSEDPDGNPIFLSVSIDVTETVELEIENRKQHETILSNLSYASKIQKNLLPSNRLFEKAFADYAVLWQPRDTVGGDIYWLKRFEKGTVLCVSDCTGHGVSGALLTMLVKSSLEEAVTEENYTDPAQILWELDQKFKTAFDRTSGACRINDVNDSCEAAVIYIPENGDILLSASSIYIFVCNGKQAQRIKGQNIHIGECRLHNKEDIKTIAIPQNADNKFYVMSDGLLDQANSETRRPFGVKAVSKILLENHAESLQYTTEKLWKAFNKHKGSTMQRDDVEIICFKP